MLTVILFLLHNAIMMICIERFISASFAKSKTSTPVVVASYLLYWVLTSLVFLLLDNPLSIAVIAIRVLTTFIITLNYDAIMRRRLVITFYFYVLILSIEALMRFVFINRFEDMFANIFYFATISLLSLIIMSLFHRYKNLKEDSSPSRFWTASFVVTFILFAMIVLSLIYLPQEIALIAVSMISVVNILNSVVHDTLSGAYNERVRLMVDAAEKEYFLSQCKLMQESIEQVKSVKHDMKLHLSTIKGFSSNIDASEITNYIDGLLDDIGKTDLYSTTGNVVVDSIINYKLSRIKEKNIYLDIRLLIPTFINVETADFVSILGNLLDNALDALANVEEKILKLDIEYKNDSLFINLENSFDGTIKYTNKSGGKDRQISTRKNSDEHGHGLKNIRKCVEKYNGHMDITYDGNMFSVGILLYVDEQNHSLEEVVKELELDEI